MRDRTTSICEQRRAWMIGRAMMNGERRFIDFLKLVPHSDALCRVMRKLVNDDLARQHNDRTYELTEQGRTWIAAALPLLSWTEAHKRNAQPMPQVRGNDPVGARRDESLGANPQ
jgi:DNA-binding HxlR family transcriptional regulator